MKIQLVAGVMMLVVGCAGAAAAKAKTDGASVYRENCISCHDLKEGAETGDRPAYMGASLGKYGRNMDVQFVRDIVRTPAKFNGETLMPSYGSMSKEDLDALVEYMKTLK